MITLGGVRTYAAEGAIVVIHSSAGDYIRAVLDQRRTLEPDRLEIARRDGRQSQPAVMLVDDSTTLTDGTRELKFYHTPNAHSSGMLVGYVPDARVVFTADLVSDTFPLNPALASAVHELIKENGLSVEMITCAHGNDQAVLGAIPGIGLAVAIAIIEFLWDGWRPHSAVLGRAEGVKGYHDITRYPNARQIPGLVLFRWDAPLFFANAEFFKERILDAVTKSPSPVCRVVVAAEPVTSVDVTAADMLTDLAKTLLNAGIELHFAELKDPVKDKLKRFGLFAKFGEYKFFPTIGAAVALYLKSHDVPWVDWEDQTQ
jgi:anti-anti-sigma regulatory factor